MMGWKQDILDGYSQFLETTLVDQKGLYEQLGQTGQHPHVMLIGCADSRVDPTDIFNAYPGEMFVARNVANLVPPCESDLSYHGISATIEYAVNVLDVDVIIVLGHENCGGVAGCLSGIGKNNAASDRFVGKWISLLDPARERVMAQNLPESDHQHALELEGIRQSLENLMTFPFVKNAVESGDLSLQGAFFGITRAELLLADNEGNFRAVSVADN